MSPSWFVNCIFSLNRHVAEGSRELFEFLHKNSDSIHEGSTFTMLITSQRLYFQMSTHWALEFNMYILEVCEHTVCMSVIQYNFSFLLLL